MDGGGEDDRRKKILKLSRVPKCSDRQTQRLTGGDCQINRKDVDKLQQELAGRVCQTIQLEMEDGTPWSVEVANPCLLMEYYAQDRAHIHMHACIHARACYQHAHARALSQWMFVPCTCKSTLSIDVCTRGMPSLRKFALVDSWGCITVAVRDILFGRGDARRPVEANRHTQVLGFLYQFR